MSGTGSHQEILKNHLQKLIDNSGANFTADDVMNEFKTTKDLNSKRKLLTILKTITKNQPTAKSLLSDVYRLFDTKDSYYCLLHFLNAYAKTQSTQQTSTINSGNKDPTSPLSSTKIFDTVTPESVSEIKERVVQAVSGGLSKSAQSSSIGMHTTSLFPVLTNTRKNTFWDITKFEIATFQQTNIIAIPLSSQENIVLTDLVYCLTGMRGSYIYPEEVNDTVHDNAVGLRKVRFRISDQIHSSLKDILYEILPLASHYITVQRFIQKASLANCGQVLQALSAALRTLTNDYYLLLAQLESELHSGDLTLFKMLFYIRPTLHTMEVLAETVQEILFSDLRGGPVLTLLFDKISSLTGDEESQKFIIQLTQLAAVPYMNILQLWIQKGIIDDPQQEFLVEDNEVISREELPEHYSADYWEKRYTIRRERIPRFLEKVSDIILRTGKYLNVIRQCGKKVTPPTSTTVSSSSSGVLTTTASTAIKSSRSLLQQEVQIIQFTPTNQNYVTVIQNAYLYASKKLLEVLLKENDLMGHLMSVKRYFLLYQGDFITQFLDACEDELSKNVDHVLPMKIENLLGLTLRVSSAKYDPYKDDLHCELLTYDLATQMSKIINNEEEYWQAHERIDLIGLECFAFKYDVKWPCSLVLNHIAISKYQMLFRQLLYCKHVERQLCKVWKENNRAKRFSPETAELYRSAFTLRQRMMNAIQNLEYYMMIEVIEPNWHIFIENMKRVENVDDVLEVHQDFLDLCLKNCMLTDPTLLRSIIKLNNICLEFCDFIQQAQRYFLAAELTSMLRENDDDNSDSETDVSSHRQTESSLAPSDTFSERVKRFDLEFTILLIGFLKQINDAALNNPSDRFINLVHRINFNSFYNEQMDKLCIRDSMAPSHHH